MNNKILFVDDDVNLLEGYKRNLKSFYEIDTALSANEAFQKILSGNKYLLIISDMRMPEMDGIKFLSMVKDKDPDITRIMLTGNADIETAINAVNDGNIFRFLTKPCPAEILKKSIDAGIEQYRLITAEKELLEKTLKGIIKVLSDILTIVNPLAFSRSVRISRLAIRTAAKFNLKNVLNIEIASMLSHIGCIFISETLLEQAFTGKLLSEREKEEIRTYTKFSYELLSKIPRFETISKIILYMEKYFNGEGYPKDEVKGNDIPLESRILKAIIDLDTLTIKISKKEAILELKEKKSFYDPNVLDALSEVITEEEKNILGQTHLSLNIPELKEKMILADDVFSKNGKFLLPKGLEVTSYLITRLKNISNNIREPIRVIIK